MSPFWLEPHWQAPAGVRALYTHRGGGVSAAPYRSLNLGDHVGDEPGAVAENRRRLRQAARLPAEPSWLRQVHGRRVVDLDAGPATGEADAAFSRRPGAVCAILTADCVPVLLAADGVVAAAHAGWRGLVAGVLEATIEALGIPPQSLSVWLGPAIGPAHYEVGAEVREAMIAAHAAAADGFTPNPRGRFMADLPLLARQRLTAAGVTRIDGSGECTHGERYFSYRRDGRTGRQATLIWLEGRDSR